jgi:hypothetical protein
VLAKFFIFLEEIRRIHSMHRENNPGFLPAPFYLCSSTPAAPPLVKVWLFIPKWVTIMNLLEI